MKMPGKKMKYGACFFLAIVLIAQFVGVERVNPPVRSEIQVDKAIATILRGACYNCHSNETVWPWYAKVAPASWLVASDVAEGRRHLNFSDWGSYDRDTQVHKLKAIEEEITDRGMPPWYYSAVHRSSRLSSEQSSQLISWAAGRNKTPLKQ